jgi:hypothetical protein
MESWLVTLPKIGCYFCRVRSEELVHDVSVDEPIEVARPEELAHLAVAFHFTERSFFWRERLSLSEQPADGIAQRAPCHDAEPCSI